MPAYTDLIASIKRSGDNTASVTITEDWMQGRTTYGGLTAALCYEAGKHLAGGKPMRAVQVAFVGPVGGDVTMQATLLREGKNTAFVSVRISYDGGVGAEAILTFGKARDSHLNFTDLPMPEVTSAAETESFFGNSPMRPAFTKNFNIKMAFGARPFEGHTKGDFGLWMRHVDKRVTLDEGSLLAIGDAPPPAVFPMMTQMGPVSSMTWMTEILTDDIQTGPDGWVFARHTAETAQGGYSSQRMVMWNEAGQPLMVGRQTIAVFA